MMTQVNEINGDKHLNMNFIEFIEAICRVAEKLAIPNLCEDDEPPEEWSNADNMKKWDKKPFHEKIEAFLLILAKNCVNEKFYAE